MINLLTFCQRSFEDPKNKYTKIANMAIEKFRKQKLIKFDHEKVYRRRNKITSYLLKINKPNVPGRPLVYSLICHPSKLSKFVDLYLQSHAKALPSYMKDTLDFINKNSETENPIKDTLLVSLAEKSLYTNIPYHEGERKRQKKFSTPFLIFVRHQSIFVQHKTFLINTIYIYIRQELFFCQNVFLFCGTLNIFGQHDPLFWV